MPNMIHVPGLDVVNYLGRYCYPKFNGIPTSWKRKIVAYRVVYAPYNGMVYSTQEVKIWKTFGYVWVDCRNIEFIWNYLEA